MAFPVKFMVSEQGYKVSSEEALILKALKLMKGYTNVDLAEHFSFQVTLLLAKYMVTR